MQPVQPSHVVPSNAPPLHDDSSLQHHGNGLSNPCNYTASIANQYASSVAGGSSYSGYTAPSSGYSYRHQDRGYRSAYRYGPGRSRYGYISEQEKEAMVVSHATELFNRFQRSDAYKKYRQRQSSKDEKASKEAQKWPDHLEVAFFRALVRWPPMGRSKYLHKDKQRGRNELIADYIKSLTGVERSRKQVSSHIQVLKPFVEHDSMIMRFLSLSKDEMNKGSGRHRGAHSSSYSELRRASQYPNAGSEFSQLQLPQIKDVDLIKHRLDAFKPSSFSMFIQKKWKTENDEEHTEREHTYTQNLDEPRNEDIIIPDWESLSQSYPFLAWMHERHWPLDCSVLVAEASIALPPADWERKPEQELGILYTCTSSRLPANTPLRCYNNFFRYGKRHAQFSGHTDFLLPHPQNGVSEVQVKFGSTFWASVLGPLQHMLHHPADDRQDPKAAILEQLENVSVVQEICLLNGQDQERILVVYWSFRQSTAATGKATWSRLILPTVDSRTTQTGDEASHQQYFTHPSPKQQRTDSFFDFNTPVTSTETVPSTAQQQAIPALAIQHPTLQSPFQYDSSCNSASALSSATWPTTISDGSIPPQSAHPDYQSHHAMDTNNAANHFNFSMNYDPSNFNVIDAGLDSSAFNFDTSSTAANSGASGNFDFPTDDQALQQYSQEWCDTGYGNAFDAYGAVAAAAAYDQQQQQQTTHPLGPSTVQTSIYPGGSQSAGQHKLSSSTRHHHQPQQQGGATVPPTPPVGAAADGYHSHHHHNTGGYSTSYDPQIYGSATTAGVLHQPREQQAYGGAGQGVGEIKDDHALAALADASFMARALQQHQTRG